MHGLERITLRSGFSFDCSHHESVEQGQVRLFLTPSIGSTSNFIDVSAQSIAVVETLPDPPPPAAAAPPVPPVVAEIDIPTLLAKAGTQHNIDVDLLAAVVKAESGGHTHAVSRTGAQGLMQLMPGTAQDLGVADAFRADQNIAGGTAYLDALLTRYHNRLDLALAAYNAGPGAVDRYHGIPPFRETRAYVARVEREFVRRKHLVAKNLAATNLAATQALATVVVH
jgi:soluble lytic murein transglycosylase-like protein